MRKAIVKFPSDYSYTSIKELKGYILFTQNNKECNVVVEVYLEGLPNGKHGFHIHENSISHENLILLKKGQTIKNLCDKLGGHFNPFNTVHGSYKYNTIRHAGDLINNLEVINNELIHLYFIDPLISLYDSDNSIINRSIVIHENEDDEGLPGLYAINKKKLSKREIESLKTGNAGKRIACGNIFII